MTEILSFAYELRNKITEWRRELHSIPELDLNLPQTQAYVLSFLEHEKIPYRTFERDSSICAWIKGTEGNRAVALRADMDALHIKEQTSLPYASKNGNMHACAHDAHTAMLMGAAAILTKIKDRFPGHVTLLFQAGEECSGGAKNRSGPVCSGSGRQETFRPGRGWRCAAPPSAWETAHAACAPTAGSRAR